MINEEATTTGVSGNYENINITIGASQSHSNSAFRGVVDQPVSSPRISNSELSALLPEFNGNNQDVDMWIERVDSVQRVYQVSDTIVQLVAVGKLEGTAKNWYLSKVEYVAMSWIELRKEMRKYFTTRSNKIVLRRNFEAKRWRRKEKFVEYLAGILRSKKWCTP